MPKTTKSLSSNSLTSKKCSLCNISGHTKSKCPTLTSPKPEENSLTCEKTSPPTEIFNPKTAEKNLKHAEKLQEEENINNPLENEEMLLLKEMEEFKKKYDILQQRKKDLEEKKKEELHKQHAEREKQYYAQYNEEMLKFFYEEMKIKEEKEITPLAMEMYKHFVKPKPPKLGQATKTEKIKKPSQHTTTKIPKDNETFACRKQKNFTDTNIEKIPGAYCNHLRIFSNGSNFCFLGYCNKKSPDKICARHKREAQIITPEHKNYLLHGDHDYQEHNYNVLSAESLL